MLVFARAYEKIVWLDISMEEAILVNKFYTLKLFEKLTMLYTLPFK